MRLRIISHNGRTARHEDSASASSLEATRQLSIGGWAVLECNDPEHCDSSAIAFFSDGSPVYVAEHLTIGARS